MEFSTADIQNMPMKDKLQLLEKVTDAIAADQQDYQSPDWHLDVLKEREKELENSDNWLNLDQVKNKFR
jgi:hypothetical protein